MSQYDDTFYVMSNTEATLGAQFMKKLTNDKVELQKSIAYRKNRVRVYLLGQKTPWNLFLLRLGTSQSSNHSVYPPFLLEGWGVGVEPPTKISKKGRGLDRISVFRGGWWEREGWLFSGGRREGSWLQFFHKK